MPFVQSLESGRHRTWLIPEYGFLTINYLSPMGKLTREGKISCPLCLKQTHTLAATTLVQPPSYLTWIIEQPPHGSPGLPWPPSSPFSIQQPECTL